MNNGIGHVWAVNAEGGDEGRPNSVGPVYIENIDKLGSQLPEPEAGDAGKVLGVLNSDGDIGWVPDQEGMAQVQADWDQDDSSQVSYIANKPTLATVATSGAYSDLSGTPTIPAAQVNSDWDAVSGVSQILNKPSLATVATSGSYADLSNKPTIPTVDQNYSASSTNAQSGTAVAQAIAAIPSASYTAGDGIDITAGEISVKAGTGLKIADASIPGATTNLVSQDIWSVPGLYQVKSFAPLTSDLLSQMANGLDVTTVGTFICSGGSLYFVALYTFSGSSVGDRLVLGSAHSGSGAIYPGTVFTFDTGNIYTSLSTVTLSQVESDIANYRLGLLTNDGSSWDVSKWSVMEDPAPASVVTATYSAMTTVQDALCVSNPLPSPTSADAAKVLTVTDTQGNFSWQPVPQELPTLTGNAGKLLAVNSGATGTEWINAPTELPAQLGTAGQVLSVNSGATGVEWATVQSGSSYTAGDGIDITANEVSVKAGTGLEIADVPTTGTTTNLVSQDIVEDQWAGYNVVSIAPLTSDLLSQMSNGLDVTLVDNFWSDPNSARGYAALYTLFGSTVGNRLVLGSYLNSTAAGTVITFDTGNIDTARSTVTLSQIESNISDYRLGILLNEGIRMTASPCNISQQEQSYTTATYTPVTTIQDALCVSNPLPASAVVDAGKILTVNNSGAPEWGMRIQQVAALPASPDANTLYLIPEA